MTPEAQRIALLLASGWKKNPYPHPLAKEMWYHPDSPLCQDGRYCELDETPDYAAVNACHEAEKIIIERGLMDGMEGYHNTLCGIIDNGNAIRATAPQRLEALVRTLGLWREDDGEDDFTKHYPSELAMIRDNGDPH